jgi:hypothetical protein
VKSCSKLLLFTQLLKYFSFFTGSWSDPLFCQTLSPNGHYHITKAIPTKIWSKSWNRNDSHIYHNPFLISCPTSVNTTSVYLSLNKNPCQIGCQKFKISLKPQPIKNTFTLCVKPLNFRKDISDHLLQWVAINRVLGADKIALYVESVTKKTQKFLEFVQKRLNGSLEVRPHRRISGGVDHDVSTQVWQKRRYEIITYNDCLYRNLHTSHFVIPVDVDEIIVPRHVSTWAELLQDVSPEGEDSFASYTVRNAYYLRHFNVKRSQEKVFFLRDLTRSEFSPEGESGKSFISTNNALTVFNHYALKGLKPGVRRNKFLKRESVQMNHYKDDCDTVILPECAKYLSSPVRIVDDVIVKYKMLFYKEYARLVALLERQRL